MIIQGDCLEVMQGMDAESVDAIVTDPPYGLEFMGKEWDKLRNTWQAESGRYHNDTTFIARGNRVRYQAGLEMQLWHAQWLTGAYRVLKPGASMLVMGGTRTFHRLMVAIEDSGFIIKDTLMWLYGSGFPKAQDLGKMIDRRERQDCGLCYGHGKKWNPNSQDGWDTAFLDEPCPRCDGDGLVAAYKNREVVGKGKYYNRQPNGLKSCNVTNFKDSIGKKYGENTLLTTPASDLAKHWHGFKVGGIKPAYEPIVWAVKPPEGSYIDNVLKWGVGAVNVDECRVTTNEDCGRPSGTMPHPMDWGNDDKYEFKPGNPKGRFPANVILDEEAGRMLDEQSNGMRASKPRGGNTVHRTYKDSMFNMGGEQVLDGEHLNDSGGASRFFYCAKASKRERGDGNTHPTVKPIALFMWLIRLVTREEQVILDPFVGSGTTMLAAQGCNRKCIGIEQDPDYCNIAEERLAQGVL